MKKDLYQASIYDLAPKKEASYYASTYKLAKDVMGKMVHECDHYRAWEEVGYDSIDDWCKHELGVNERTRQRLVEDYLTRQRLAEATTEEEDLIVIHKASKAQITAIPKGADPKEAIEALKTSSSHIEVKETLRKNVNIDVSPESNLKDEVIDVEIEPKINYKELYENTLKELKHERALKDKRNKEIKELKSKVDVIPIREAEERLAKYWDLYTLTMRNWADRMRKIHMDGFKEKAQFTDSALNGDNPFKAIGLADTATLFEVKAKYRDLAKLYHPDKGEGNEENFRLISEAYTIIKRILK